MCGMEASGSPSIGRHPRSIGARRSGFDPGSCRGWTPWKSETLAMEPEPVGWNKGLSPSHLRWRGCRRWRSTWPSPVCFRGAVRLARFLHTEEVTGSSPVGSTRSYETHVGKILHIGRSTAGTYQRGQGSLTRPATACVARRAWVLTTSLWCGLPCDPSGGWTPLAGRGRSPAIDAPPRSTQTVKGPVCKTVITGSTPVSASQVLHRGSWVHSSVDRASVSGAEGRGFESH